MTIPVRFDGVMNGFLRPYFSAMTRSVGAADPRSADAAEISPSETARQRELDSLVADIDRASRGRGPDQSGFRVEDPSTALSRFRIGNAHLQPGQSVDMNIDVTASAQLAGLYLSFGGQGGQIGFQGQGSAATFHIQIEGFKGGKELVFLSGTSMLEVADAINAFADLTGVVASSTKISTGLSLRSTGYGSHEFVSVRATGPGADQVVGGGVYGFDPNDANSIDPGRLLSTFAGLDDGVTDVGQDVSAIINNHQIVTGEGTLLTYAGPYFTAQMDLETGWLSGGETANAENLGRLFAGRVWYDELNPLSTTDPGIDVSG